MLPSVLNLMYPRELHNERAFAELYQNLSKIDTGKGQIRLLHIHPGTASDPLACTVRVSSLCTHPRYEALSYTWRDSNAPADPVSVAVRLNDILVYVLPNLGVSLQHLRLKEGERVLWVDFLCIDQGNVVERSEQVQQMGSIYQSAAQVIIFLGDGGDEVESAFQILLDIGRDMHLSDLFDREDPSSQTQKASCLIKLLSRDWFSRLWTVQEAVLAQHAIMQCGQHSMPWEALEAAAQCFWKHIDCCEYYLQNHKEANDMFCLVNANVGRLEWSKQQLQNTSLSALLERFRAQKVTDPRDQVFALLSLLRPDQQLLLPDYTLSTHQIYTRTAFEILTSERSLQYLEQTDYTSRDRELPSWVPDLTKPCVKHLLTRTYRVFSASGDTQATIRAHPDNEIVLKGILVDTVSDIDLVAKPLQFSGGISNQRDARDLFEHLLRVEAMAASLDQWPEKDEDDEQYLYPVWRTAVMGITEERPLVERRLRPDDYATCSTAKRLLKQYAQCSESTPLAEFFAMIEKEQVWRYCLLFTTVAMYSRFFLTGKLGRKRRMGTGPVEILPGDRIAILAGGKMPFVLRKLEQGCTTCTGSGHASYALIGVAYVDGIMDGVVDTITMDQDAEWDDIYIR